MYYDVFYIPIVEESIKAIKSVPFVKESILWESKTLGSFALSLILSDWVFCKDSSAVLEVRCSYPVG